MTCKDCLHGELCMGRTDTIYFNKTEYQDLDNVEKFCEDFKNKADFVEIKYGKWIWDINAIDWGIGGWVCSECHTVNSNIPQKPTYRPLLWAGSKFCPNCGANMNGGKK